MFSSKVYVWASVRVEVVSKQMNGRLHRRADDRDEVPGAPSDEQLREQVDNAANEATRVLGKRGERGKAAAVGVPILFSGIPTRPKRFRY